VNWMAANSNSNVRSLFGFTAQNPAVALQRRRLVFSGLGRECFGSGPWKVARNRRRAKRGPAPSRIRRLPSANSAPKPANSVDSED
jgi:hypothetical protein